MIKYFKIEEYRELKVVKKSLEYKLCLAIDPEVKKKLKREMYNLKLHLRILENGLNYLKIKDEYDILYLAYFKEGWQFKTTEDIAEELHISTYSVYKYKNLGKKRMQQYFARLDIENKEIIDIKEKLELNRKEVDKERIRRNALSMKSRKKKREIAKTMMLEQQRFTEEG